MVMSGAKASFNEALGKRATDEAHAHPVQEAEAGLGNERATQDVRATFIEAHMKTRLERVNARLTATIATIGGIVALLGAILGIFTIASDATSPHTNTSNTLEIPTYVWIAIGIILVLVLSVGLALLYLRIRLAQRRADHEAAVFAAEQAALRSAREKVAEQMSLGTLHDYNRLLLADYHQIATEQASSSFRSSRRAMWGGFAWLKVCFGAAVWQVTTTGSQVLIGTLAAVGGTLSGYLSRTYLRVYERTLLQLNQYYRQPLLNSYLLSAERIVRDLDSAELKNTMYEQLLMQIIASAGALDKLLSSEALGAATSVSHLRSRASRESHPAQSEGSASAS